MKVFVIIMITLFTHYTFAISHGSFMNLDVGFQQSKFINDETNQEFNYSGIYFNLNFNKQHVSAGSLQTYWGLGVEFNQQDNNSNNQVDSEQAQHLSPNIFYRFSWKKFSLLTSYSYVFAKHEGTGLRQTNLDFSIHKLNLQLSYYLDIKPSWYFSLFYKYGTGLVFDLDNDHSYQDHVFGLGLIYQFDSSNSTSSGVPNKNKKSKPKNTKSRFFLY